MVEGKGGDQSAEGVSVHDEKSNLDFNDARDDRMAKH